ncbi:MAG: hypothetical protein ABI823_01580 [Bryobacteraceae bacterium]
MRPMLFLLLSALLATSIDAADAKLHIENATVQQIEDGPALLSSESYVSGETVYFSCQIGGYQVSPKEKISLLWDISVKDGGGVLLVPSYSGKIGADIFQEDKKWLPKARHSFVIPPHAGGGEYKILFHAKDALSGSEATKELAFRVRGSQVEPSETFVVRNLRFFRSEEDRRALSPAAYRGGDTMFARFEITGYKLGPDNAFDVVYGIEILKESGESMYAQPDAAGEKDATFYPRHWVPGVMNLKIPTDIAKAPYTLVIKATDKLGDQKAETRGTFTVE